MLFRSVDLALLLGASSYTIEGVHGGARQDQQGHRHQVQGYDKILENIDGKVTEVWSSNLQVLNMMKMLEMQVAQLVGRLSSNEGKFPGQPQSPETAKAIQTRSGSSVSFHERV